MSKNKNAKNNTTNGTCMNFLALSSIICAAIIALHLLLMSLAEQTPSPSPLTTTSTKPNKPLNDVDDLLPKKSYKGFIPARFSSSPPPAPRPKIPCHPIPSPYDNDLPPKI